MPSVTLIAVLTRRGRQVVSALQQHLYWRLARSGGFRRHLEEAVTNMPQGICLYNADDKLQLVNEQFCRIYNQPMSALRIGMEFREMLANSMEVGNYPGRTLDEVWLTRKKFIDCRQPGTFLQELGDGRLIAISHQPLAGGGWVATYEDITERRRAEMQIKFMAQHDMLTQLPNRLLFGEQLEQALAEARGGNPCALICLDLDGFKAVNDRLGHAAGDLLLLQVAQRLQSGLRGKDIAARLGGDEFAVLLRESGEATALQTATRIGAALRREYDLGHFGPAQVDVSLGVACAPDQADEPEILLSRADYALYVAKRGGQGTPYLYDAPVTPDARPRHTELKPSGFPRNGLNALRDAETLVDDLRKALRDGHLHLEYQPVCDCVTGDPTGYEALLRWIDPVRGAVAPSEFIPAAENSGFIVTLSEWVLYRACAEAASWAGTARVSVNLSPLDFSRADLVPVIAAVLVETGLQPNRLIIEITESMLLDNSMVMQERIHGIRQLGVELWLDDFGTGYANFSTLAASPFTTIKIDRSFLAEGASGRVMLGAMISFGHTCGFKVIVEGVETTDQLSMLRGLGCEQVQGYLLGKPMKPGELAHQSGCVEATRAELAVEHEHLAVTKSHASFH